MKEITEEWKDIEGYEGKYQVSNTGQVRNHKKYLKKIEVDCWGYCRVHLYKDGKYKHFKVHRLVLNAFNPNKEGLPQINHKDCNRLNNCLENLEWCDAKYNNNYGDHSKKIGDRLSKAVIQLDMNGNEIARYTSVKDATNITGFKNIDACARGQYGRKTSGGYKWKYAS